MYKKFLVDSGLSEGEATIYDILLQNGEISAATLTKQAPYKRGMIYKYLDDLKKRGLVSTFQRNKKTHFRPEHPNKLLQQIESDLNQTIAQQRSLEAIMPQLESSYLLQTTKPGITYFEDLTGIKKIFDDIYSPKDEVVYGAVDFEKANQAIPDYIQKKLIPLRINNKVFANSFIADSPTAREVSKKDEISLRKSVLLNKEKYPLPAEIDVYDNKIAMLSFEKGKFVGVLIENKDLATTLKSIFKLAFEKSYEESSE